MLNLDSRSRSKLLWVGTLLVPALAVQGVRIVFGSSPASASAATALAPTAAPIAPIPAPEAAKPLSPAQAKAVAWILSRQKTLNQRSPMDRPDSIAELAAPSPVMHAGGSTPSPKPAAPVSPSGMTLTGLFSGGSDGQPAILINHKLYHVGDAIVPNWRILSVDVETRTVRIAGPDGQNIDLSLAGSER